MGNPVVFFSLPISWQLDSALLIGTARKIPLILGNPHFSNISGLDQLDVGREAVPEASEAEVCVDHIPRPAWTTV